MHGPQPPSLWTRKPFRAAVVVGALVALGLFVQFGVHQGPAKVRQAFQPGKSVQEGVLAIPSEHRRFRFNLRSLPSGRFTTSLLEFEGESVLVTARDALSRSGRVEVNQALAQLSGEIATTDSSVTGWEIHLGWDSQPLSPAGVQLSREGVVR
ncbi:MAG: hypothetical protein JKY65_14755 [Planctomycetes bacterium]|nr:hypothetical protein [Planctomycetota bacterium]